MEFLAHLRDGLAGDLAASGKGLVAQLREAHEPLEDLAFFHGEGHRLALLELGTEADLVVEVECDGEHVAVIEESSGGGCG